MNGFAPLTGLPVLELGDGVAGAAATSTLASLGASVTTVTRPGALLHALLPAIHVGEGRTDSALAAVLGAGKEAIGEVGPERLAELVATSDVVVCDRVHGAPPPLPVPPEDYAAFVATHNRRAWVTVSPYGLRGRLAGRVGSDLTVAAAGGLLSAVYDPESKRPIKFAGSQALLSAGAAAALAACHALSEVAATGRPQHADVSAQAAVLTSGPVLQLAMVLLNGAGLGGANRFGAPSGFFRCRDGLVRITAMEQHQWQGLIRALGNPDWAADFSRVDDRIDRADTVNAAIEDALATWGKVECEERLQAEGVPATAQRSMRELLESAQFASRDAFGEVEVYGGRARIIVSPFRVVPTSPPPDAPPVAPTLRGMRVLEASHILAVPLAGALLGAMGADVIKIEDPERPDSYRTRGPYVDRIPDPDRSAYFAVMNHSKHSLDVDLGCRDSVDALLDATDVVMENLGPRRARRVGLDAPTAASRKNGVLALSSSGYGHTGPWSSYRIYAYNLHTACGLVELTRTPAGGPTDIDVAWADTISGYAIATLVAAWGIGRGRLPGASVDFAMAECVAGRFNDFLAATDRCAQWAGPEDGSNHQPPYAPHSVYPTADGGWIAIAVLSEENWTALTEVLGRPPSLAGQDFAVREARLGHQEQLDAAMGEQTKGWEAGALTEQLAARGVPASPVLSAEQLAADADLYERGLFQPVDHPLWGRHPLIGLAWEFVGREPVPLGAPPRLGNARSAPPGTWPAEAARCSPQSTNEQR